MTIENFIPITALCTHYNVEMSFFGHLNELDLIEIKIIENLPYIHQDSIYEVEKILRIYQELDVNIEGIDIVFNLLQKMENLQNELVSVKNRLRLYEK